MGECTTCHELACQLLRFSSDNMARQAGDARKHSRHVASRREGPRLEIEAVIDGRLARGNLRLELYDLGFGGFAIESPIAFSIGARREFRFTTTSGAEVSLTAEAVHTTPVGSRDGMEHYRSGFRYLVQGSEAQTAVETLIEAATSPLLLL